MFGKLSLEVASRFSPSTVALISLIVAVFNPTMAVMILTFAVIQWIVRSIQSTSMDLSAGGVILVFLLCILGLYLSPNIASAVTTAALNFTGAARSLLLLFPLIWVMLMISIPLAFLIAWLRKQ